MDLSVEEAPTRGTRWVCPNDRHLALRAKLRTGWSVKTGSLDSRWGGYPGSNSYSDGANRCGQSFVLSEEERHSIIQVIQRAEALDLSEQERVGRLVERLENMKRNVCIVTTMRSNERRSCGRRCSGGTRCVCACALCGEKFGAVLGASPSLCKDCRKYICQKCGIETSVTSNIGPNESKTVIEPERTTVQRIVRRSAGNPHKQFLCRICAETREMWKKSGAWFFKGMPKYILPEKKERGWTRSGHRTSAWTISTCKSLDTSEPQDSSSDEDATRRLVVARGQSVSTTSLQGTRDNNQPSTPSIASQASFSPKSPRGRSNNGLSPTRQKEEACMPSERLVRSSLSIPSQCSRLSTSSSITTIRSRSGGRSPSGVAIEQKVSFENEATNDDKATDADVDEDYEDENAHRESSATDRLKGSQVQSLRRVSSTTTLTSIIPNHSSDQQQQFKGTVQDKSANSNKDWELEGSVGKRVNSQIDIPQLHTLDCLRAPATGTGQDYGTLEVSLQYDPAVQCLQCKVERARGLKPMDIHGLSDPFCKLNILPVGRVGIIHRLRTKTVHKTCNPVFNEILNFYGITENDMNGKALHILILQDDQAGQDFLGEAKFPLRDLHPYQIKHCNVRLQDHYRVENEEETWGVHTNGRGQIQITLSYCTRRRALLITVHRAMNLLPMDSNGFSDPFVKVCLIENATNNHRQHRTGVENSISRVTVRKLTGKKTSQGRNVHNTSVKRKTLNPEWNEEFAFGTRLTDLIKLTLYLSVWDKDFGKSNDYLGGLMLGCSSKGARLRHWVDAIKFPDHRHQAWHELTEEIMPTE